MSAPKKDGGAAFPVPGSPLYTPGASPMLGMTLRDYFAGQALAGILADSRTTQEIGMDPRPVADAAAADAYQYADAMLRERDP